MTDPTLTEQTTNDPCHRCGGPRTPSARKFSADYCLSCFNSPARIPEAAAAYLASITEGEGS